MNYLLIHKIKIKFNRNRTIKYNKFLMNLKKNHYYKRDLNKTLLKIYTKNNKIKNIFTNK